MIRFLASFIASFLFLMFIVLSITQMKEEIARLSLSANSLNASPKAIGELIFADHLFAFEVLSLVLLACMIAAIFLIKE